MDDDHDRADGGHAPRAQSTTPTRTRSTGGSIGRPLHALWQHFAAVPPHKQGAAKGAQCLYCDEIIRSAKPTLNMNTHLIAKCRLVPEEIQRVVEREYAPQRSAAPYAARRSSTGGGRGSRASTSDDRNDEYDDYDEDDSGGPRLYNQDAVHMLVARLFHKCDLPYAISESGAFRLVFETTRPRMRAPTREELTGSLLERVREENRVNSLNGGGGGDGGVGL